MTRADILAKFHAETRRLPWKIQMMAAKYLEAIQEGTHTPHKLMRHGARLLNSTFQRAEGGDIETQQMMVRDGVDAITLAAAAELFRTTADQLEGADG